MRLSSRLMRSPLIGRLFAAGLAIAAGLGLAGCPVESDAPLGPVEEAVEDPAIYGLWFSNENDASTWFHIYRATDAPAGTVEVTMVSTEADNSGEMERYSGHLTRLGDLFFGNVQGPLGGGAPSGPYYIVNYRIAADGALEMRLLKGSAVQAAFAAKTLTGGTAEGKPDEYITDSSERIRAFIAASDPAQLFEAPIRLTPVKAGP